MRLYYGHCGQPLQTLQTQGLSSINYIIYYGHYYGQSCNALKKQAAYVED